jgi:uncharacterized membrane protein YfcA
VREAAAVSLVSVIVTSSAAASVYLQRHTANLRLGMTLELFTASGALVGGLVAFLLSEQVLAGLFTVLLVYTALTMARRREPEPEPIAPAVVANPNAGTGAATDHADLSAAGDAPAAAPDRPAYVVHRLGWGIVGSLFAGLVSALLGIGGGLVKVPVMHLVMGVPLRVATATSNLMIGITAAASAIIYLLRGGIDVYVAGPTAVGVFVGASIGSRTVHRIDVRILRMLFVAVLLFTAWQMAGRALR